MVAGANEKFPVLDIVTKKKKKQSHWDYTSYTSEGMFHCKWLRWDDKTVI